MSVYEDIASKTRHQRQSRNVVNEFDRQIQDDDNTKKNDDDDDDDDDNDDADESIKESIVCRIEIRSFSFY
jgi:hypothetical protein